jgi:hypothetical protein
MSRREAERFEKALQQATQDENVEGRLARLVQIAQQLSFLAEPPPPPPARLLRGRQRFLSEAVKLREVGADRRKERFMVPRFIKWASVLVALMLVFGAVLGAGQAAADSLPGQLLYEVKLAAEQVRLRLTSDPEARAELNLTLAERRLSEIAELVTLGKTPDASAFDRAREQLESAMVPVKYGEEMAPEWAFQRLMTAVQRHQREMERVLGALPESDQTPVRQLVRAMERVRAEWHTGEGEPEGQQERERLGSPPEVDDLPEPKRTPGPAGMPQPTDDSDRRADPEPTERPGSGGQPGQGPGAGSGAGMEPTPQPREGGPGEGQAPAGPGPSVSPQPGDGGQKDNPSPGPGGDSGGKGKP